MTAAQTPTDTAQGLATPGPSRIAARLAGVVWGAGLLLVGLIAVAAVGYTGVLAAEIWGTGLDRSGFIWMGRAAALVVAALIGLAAVVALARRGHDLVAASIGIAAIVATRAIAIATIPTPLTTDWGDYHRQAALLAADATLESARPPGWPFTLGLLYRLGGPDPRIGEVFALLCAVAVGGLIYLIARRSFGGVGAAAGLFLWATSPGPALFTVVLASEHLYTVLFLAAIVLAALALERRWIAWIPVGVVLAMAQYVRPVGLVILPAFMVLPFLVGIARRRAILGALGLLVAYGLVIAPSIVTQYERYGRVTLSTSNFDGWSLFVGLNAEHGGEFNADDMALVGAAPESVEFRDRSYRLAIERLTRHPEAIFVLAVPKFATMWGDDTYGAEWTLRPDRPSHPRAAAAATLLSQVAYAVVVVLAAAFLWIRRHEREPVVLLALLCLGAVAASAVFLEVQPRYHAFFEPLFCLFAGVTVAWLAERRPRRAAGAPRGGWNA